MPVTTAVSSAQLPIYYNHENGSNYSRGGWLVDGYTDLDSRPRYYFGYGLSYTEFEVHSLELNKDAFSGSDVLEARVTVSNTGAVAGDDVLQLYVRDAESSIAQPVKKLAGFYRVSLQPGERKTVTFSMKISQLAFLDEDMKWKVEKGEMELQVCDHAQKVLLTKSFAITEDAWPDPRSRGFFMKTKESQLDFEEEKRKHGKNQL